MCSCLRVFTSRNCVGKILVKAIIYVVVVNCQVALKMYFKGSIMIIVKVGQGRRQSISLSSFGQRIDICSEQVSHRNCTECSSVGLLYYFTSNDSSYFRLAMGVASSPLLRNPPNLQNRGGDVSQHTRWRSASSLGHYLLTVTGGSLYRRDLSIQSGYGSRMSLDDRGGGPWTKIKRFHERCICPNAPPSRTPAAYGLFTDSFS